MPKGMLATVRVRKGRLPKDLELLVGVVSEEDTSERDLIRRGLWYAYRRFPEGLFVAEHDGRVVGFLQLGFQRPTFLTYLLGKQPSILPTAFYDALARIGVLRNFEVANIVISPRFRGRGVAYRLMDLAETEAVRTYKQHRICLMVREANERALRFYERLGYEQIGTIPMRVGEKLLLRKELTSLNSTGLSR